MSDFIDRQVVIDEINEYFFHIGLMAKNENEKLAITALMKDVIAIIGETYPSSDAIPVEWVKKWWKDFDINRIPQHKNYDKSLYIQFALEEMMKDWAERKEEKNG